MLDARNEYPDSSLAVLYNREAMPASLRAAHLALDKAVLNAYRLKSNATDIAVLGTLFDRYATTVNGLLAVAKTPRKSSRIPKKVEETAE